MPYGDNKIISVLPRRPPGVAKAAPLRCNGVPVAMP